MLSIDCFNGFCNAFHVYNFKYSFKFQIFQVNSVTQKLQGKKVMDSTLYEKHSYQVSRHLNARRESNVLVKFESWLTN